MERPLRVVIDTDAANEIDDQFALAWALLAPERLRLEAITAAPFSIGTYFSAMVSAHATRGGPPSQGFEELAVSFGADTIAELVRDHDPGDGMERSYAEIVRVLDAASPVVQPRIERGATTFMSSDDQPVASDAATTIIELAHASDEPLYVAILGAPTNVASALVMDPSIAQTLVPVFVAGYPSMSDQVDDSFNLVQDRHATNVIFGPDTNLVYVPGYQTADVLSVSLPEIEKHVAPHGELGALLHRLFLDNPLAANPTHPGHSWVMWDLAPLAWLINPTWLRTMPRPGAAVDQAHRWQPSGGNHLEAYRIDKRGVYSDFFTRLARIP